MNLAVIIPVGPGHKKISKQAMSSVLYAQGKPHPWKDVRPMIVMDERGKLGRGRARNEGMDACPFADWFFFLDADDEMMPNALSLNDFGSPATFGAVCLDGAVSRNNVYPLYPDMLFEHGAKGTLSMGFFVSADIARRLRFSEDMDAGEDFDFYIRLPWFTKVNEPLVNIGYSRPSAAGPRGRATSDWHRLCREIIDRGACKNA